MKAKSTRTSITLFVALVLVIGVIMLALVIRAQGKLKVMRYPAVNPWFNIEREYYTVNNQLAEFYFDVAEEDEHCKKVFRTYEEAMRYAEENELEFLTSVQMVNAKCKQFDDGMYAALEKLVQSGNEDFSALKKDLLKGLYYRLILYYGRDDPELKEVARTALVYVGAALYYGKVKTDLPEELIADIRKIEPDKPTGFFTWDEELEAIFMQDRVLMNRIIPVADALYEGYDPLKDTIHIKSGLLISYIVSSDANLKATHERIISFYAHMTNPRRHPTVRDVMNIAGRIDRIEEALVDGELVDRLREKLPEKYPQVGPGDFSLIPYAFSREDYFVYLMWDFIDWRRQVMEQFIEAIRNGMFDLKPKDGSGWYSYQQYALETLVMPEKSYESKKIEFSAKYKKRLEEAFKTILTKKRETHIKNLDEKLSAELDGIAPEFSVEPLATVYLRLARSYRFVQGFLEGTFGSGVVGSIHGLREGGERAKKLNKELDYMVRLMYGLHLISCHELGLDPDLMEGELSVEEQDRMTAGAQGWLKNLSRDDDFAVDTRVAVSIASFPGAERNTYTRRYWATAGVRFKRLEYTYKVPPKIVDSDKDYRIMGGRILGGSGTVPIIYYAPEDVFAEFRSLREERHPMDREDFRKVCDEHETMEDLKKALRAIESKEK